MTVTYANKNNHDNEYHNSLDTCYHDFGYPLSDYGQLWGIVTDLPRYAYNQCDQM